MHETRKTWADRTPCIIRLSDCSPMLRFRKSTWATATLVFTFVYSSLYRLGFCTNASIEVNAFHAVRASRKKRNDGFLIVARKEKFPINVGERNKRSRWVQEVKRCHETRDPSSAVSEALKCAERSRALGLSRAYLRHYLFLG